MTCEKCKQLKAGLQHVQKKFESMERRNQKLRQKLKKLKAQISTFEILVKSKDDQISSLEREIEARGWAHAGKAVRDAKK